MKPSKSNKTKAKDSPKKHSDLTKKRKSIRIEIVHYKNRSTEEDKINEILRIMKSNRITVKPWKIVPKDSLHLYKKKLKNKSSNNTTQSNNSNSQEDVTKSEFSNVSFVKKAKVKTRLRLSASDSSASSKNDMEYC